MQRLSQNHIFHAPTRSQLMIVDNINAQRLSAPEVSKLMIDLTGSLAEPIKGMSGMQSVAASPTALHITLQKEIAIVIVKVVL